MQDALTQELLTTLCEDNNLGAIPKYLWTDELLNTVAIRWPLLTTMSFSDQLDKVPQHLLTIRNLTKNTSGTTPLHEITNKGLAVIDTSTVTEEHILAQCKNGANVLHRIAIREGELSGLPQRLLTRRTLTEIFYNYKNVLQWMFGHNTLKPISIESLDSNMLMTQMQSSLYTTLQWAIFCKKLSRIPKRLLTEEVLVYAPNGMTPLSMLEREPENRFKNTAPNQLSCQLDYLLGTELSSQCKHLVGDEWWNRNQEVLQSKCLLTTNPKYQEISLW